MVHPSIDIANQVSSQNQARAQPAQSHQTENSPFGSAQPYELSGSRHMPLIIHARQSSCSVRFVTPHDTGSRENELNNDASPPGNIQPTPNPSILPNGVNTEHPYHPTFHQPVSTVSSGEESMSRRLANMEVVLRRLLGATTPIKRRSHSFVDSPFIDAIAQAEMPRKFALPTMKAYDGTTDLDDHLASFKQRMSAINVPTHLREICMCRSFRSTLVGPTLQWYTNLPMNSIGSFGQLADTFSDQFASSNKLEKMEGDLYRVYQFR